MILNTIKNKTNKIYATVKNYLTHRDVSIIVESADWVIKQIGFSISENLENISTQVVEYPFGIRKSIIHFGSINAYLGAGTHFKPHRSNRIVVTWYHISPDDNRIESILKAQYHVDVWHTASIITKNELLDIGISADKIKVIPLGVNLKTFYNVSAKEKETIRERFGLPKGKIIIGSFQKDGNGWGEGLEPKLIKGPDIFCDVVERLSKTFELFVLLTGPARGYVKRRLEQVGIPYLHSYLKCADDLGDYYRALDIYLSTARVEGGPQCVLESLASGVAIVATKVGLTPDIITNGENGMLCEICDVDEIVGKSIEILKNKSLADKLITAGLETSKKHSWPLIAKRHQHEIYESLL
jgi:glycosyltransferase involved in cell wall biosynthesis